MQWILRVTFVFFSVSPISFCLAKSYSCLRDYDCYEISYKYFCCHGKCTMNDTVVEDGCRRPVAGKHSAIGYIIIIIVTVAVIVAIILCFRCRRCPCFKRRTLGIHSNTTVTCAPACHTTAGLTTMASSFPAQLYPITSVPQGPCPYLPPYSTADPSGKEEEEKGEKENAPMEAPPPYVAWEDVSLPQAIRE